MPELRGAGAVPSSAVVVGMSGYVAMKRDWQGHHLFDGDEFSRRDAWAWLIAQAAWKDGRVRIKGSTVPLKRGELSFSVRFLAEKWGWSKSKVDRFLHSLRAEGMIATRSKTGTTAGQSAGQGQCIVSICNYDKFQVPLKSARDSYEPESGTTAGQQRDKEEEGKKDNSSVAKATSPRAKPRSKFPPPPNVSDEQWQAFNDQRKKPLTARAYALIGNKLLKVSAESGWPPGELIDLAVERGWETVFTPRTFRNERSNSPSPVDQLVAASFAFSNGVGEDTEAGGADLDGRSGADSVARFGH